MAGNFLRRIPLSYYMASFATIYADQRDSRVISSCGGSLIRGATLATGLTTSVDCPAASRARRCASKILSRFFLPARFFLIIYRGYRLFNFSTLCRARCAARL